MSKKDETLGPARRIKHRGDFLRIQHEGSKFRSKHFLLILRSDPIARGKFPLEDSRIGVAVTTKVHKRAVQRNRIKRYVRELFRRERSKFVEPVDMVVIALQGATELSFLGAVRELKYLFYQSKLLPENPRRAASKAR